MYQQNVTLGPGTGTFASHTLEILIMLLGAFLLGLWLGWVLWNRYRQEADRLRLENEGLTTGMNNLNAELGSLKGRFTTLDNERADLAARLLLADNENIDLRVRLDHLTQNLTEVSAENRQLNTELNLNNGEMATIAMGAELPEDPAPVVPEELMIDKPQERNPENDIVIAPATSPSVTLTIQMNTPVSTVTVQEDEKNAGELSDNHSDSDAFALIMEDHHPDFESSSETSASRDVYVPTITDHFSDEAFESLTRNAFAPPVGTTSGETVSIPVLTPLQQDDLKIVEGIGPKIEQLLFKAGIHTYSELAAAPVSRLKEILAEAGPRYAMHDPGTWSAQSLLAANGEWENLKAYQEFLDAGKRPTS